MAKRSSHMTSDSAATSFKTKISESLPLLGFLNNTDKVNIWRFWKTVSSAVKIAVNGRGDILETQRQNSKLAREKEFEEYRMQQLDTSAITIYVPVKCLEKGSRRFRILKLANQKKVADYFETIKVEGEDSSHDIAADNNLELSDFSEPCDAGNGNTLTDTSEKLIVERVSCEGESLGTDEDLQAVASFLRDNDTLQEPLTATDKTVEDMPVKLEKSKPLKKIWLVGRPTTRSSTSPRVLKDKHPERDGKIPRSKESKSYTSKVSVPKTKIDVENNDMTAGTLNFYPDVKHEVLEEAEDFGITVMPVGSDLMHIAHNSISSTDENLQDTHIALVKTESSEQCSPTNVQIYSHAALSEEALPGYSVHVSLPVLDTEGQDQEVNKEYSLQVHHVDHVPQQEFISTVEIPLQCDSSNHNTKEDMAHGHLIPRNASDIETIISALEEELKKTASEIATVSVTSAHGVEDVPSSIGEVRMEHSSYVDTSGQTVQFIQGQEMVEVQHVDNVIWTTTEGEVQIVEPGQILNEAATEEGEVYESQPVHAQYDVVEYEVLTDRRQKRGRKKKLREESTGEKASLIDRTCPMCHRVLNYASSMTAHMRIHTGVRPYSCGQCDRKFTTKANRDRHEATHVGLKPFQCTQCSKSFTEKRSLKIHMRTHTGERPFACDVCGQRFTQKCTLQVHMDRHTNKKGHLCDLCGKAFRQKCQLDVHVKRHNRQALYPCHECSTKCYTKGDLVRHMIKHTGERPFRCNLCPRAFTRKQYLVDHENQHYGRKPYRCSVCSATFHDMGSCHRHLKKHKVEGDGDKSPAHSALLSSSDFHRILEGTQIGQIIKLDDGSDALVKAVVSEADGSTVYHITCLGKSDGKDAKLPDEPTEQVVSSAASDTPSLKEEASEK